MDVTINFDENTSFAAEVNLERNQIQVAWVENVIEELNRRNHYHQVRLYPVNKDHSSYTIQILNPQKEVVREFWRNEFGGTNTFHLHQFSTLLAIPNNGAKILDKDGNVIVCVEWYQQDCEKRIRWAAQKKD